MRLDCDYCGNRLTIRSGLAQCLVSIANRIIDYDGQARTKNRLDELERRHRADREVILSLSHNYKELAACYKSMQVSICVIRDIYSGMSEKIKSRKMGG
mgnify:CR=1 FL=1